MAVAAIDEINWLTGPQQPYSSQGPTNDGRSKPDISGPDNVSNWTEGWFPGTSASAPHVAGAAALVLSRYPSLTPQELASYLSAQAISDGLQDYSRNVYGAGRLALDDAEPPTVVDTSQTTAPATDILVIFSEAMDESTLSNSTIFVQGSATGNHTCSFSYEPSTDVLTIDPLVDFSYGETAYVTISTSVTDLAGNGLETPYSFDFVVSSEPTHTIGGYVYEGTSGLSGVWVTDGSRGDYTDGSGRYDITGVPDGWYTVTPSKAGYTFNPSSSVPIHVDGANRTVNPFYGTPSGGNEGLYYPAADTSVSMRDKYTRFGSDPRLWVGRNSATGGYQPDWGLIRFDVSDISGKTVWDPQLKLYFDYDDGATIRVEAHKMLDSWPENIRYSEWNHSYSSQDVDESVSGSGWETWDGSYLRTWVQDWVDNPSTNYGLFLESADSDYVKHGWVSKEGNSQYWPRLEMTVLNTDVACDLVVSEPQAVGGASPPFAVGQTVQWRVMSTNNGPGDAYRHDVGFYLGLHPNDFSNRLGDDRIGPVVAGDSVDNDDFQHPFSQIGTFYLNVWVDDDDGAGGSGEVLETNNNNNKNSYGPFQVVYPNQAPTISGLPDRSLQEDGFYNNAIDLWAYATDVETPDSGLSFSINNAPDPGAGVVLDGNRYVDVYPTWHWCGTTDVEIRVADPQGLADTDTFQVTVTCVNDPPRIDPSVDCQSEDVDVAITIDLTAHERDVEDSGTALDWQVTGEEHCTVSGENSDDDVLTFTPIGGFEGTDTVTLHLLDSQGGEDTQDVVLTWGDLGSSPTLSWTGEVGYEADGVQPESGSATSTFEYRVQYGDSDGDAPNYVRVHVLKGGTGIGGSPFDMTYVSGEPTTGAVYAHSLSGLAEGTDYSYYFEAQDSTASDANPTPQLSGPTVSGQDTETVPLGSGWTLLSLPLDPTSSYTAEGLCVEVNGAGGTIIEVDRWFAGGWDSHICGLPFNDFDIELGGGYFAKSTAAANWTVTGYTVSGQFSIQLNSGWNLVSLPKGASYTAESLAQAINAQGGTCVEIDRWHAGGWDSHITGLPFNDFDIEAGTAYFVKCTSASTFITTLP